VDAYVEDLAMLSSLLLKSRPRRTEANHKPLSIPQTSQCTLYLNANNRTKLIQLVFFIIEKYITGLLDDGEKTLAQLGVGVGAEVSAISESSSR